MVQVGDLAASRRGSLAAGGIPERDAPVASETFHRKSANVEDRAGLLMRHG